LVLGPAEIGHPDVARVFQGHREVLDASAPSSLSGQFSVLEPPETPVREAYTRLVRKIEAGLAVRYLCSTDFPGAGASQNRLYAKGTAVNGRIDERDGTPVVVVDGREYSWEQFGEFLSCFSGFDFRLECFDACESREITPDPVRPNPISWLPQPEHPTFEDRRHH
jgi:hypothetical protein